ncbi:MAG: DUF4230 domain-containing protein [Bacteroidales bacterium]|nr:DUF4230 domain-containing protein [Bacteroidales bacterium]
MPINLITPTMSNLPVKNDRTWHEALQWLRRINKVTLTVTLVVIAAVLVFAAYGILRLSHAIPSHGDITLEQTPIDIEAVRPRGELYVATAVIEEYVSQYSTEFHFGLIPEPHSCVQILRQKVSYVIDLEEVRYIADTPDTVIVQMPPLRYVASTQDSPFLSDDEDFWVDHMPSTNDMKREVEEKIRQRFDTPENRRKAERNAEASISLLLKRLGYEARFAPHIDTDENNSNL